MPREVLFEAKRNYFILNIIILYLATTTTTTILPSCASSCSGSFSNYDNTTTCGYRCHDTGTYTCLSGSTYCPGLYFNGNGNLDGTCNGTPCPTG